jgi:hypothetical protein
MDLWFWRSVATRWNRPFQRSCDIHARNAPLSVAYNFGAWFGGFMPTIAFTSFTVTGNFYAGLWYAIVLLVCSAVVGALFLPETRGRCLRAIE